MDIWLFALILGALFFVGIQLAVYHAWSGVFMVLLLLLVVAWIMADTWYKIADNGKLIVRCAFYRKIINIKDIRKISGSRSILSSPALSIDRVLVEYGKHSSILISPNHRKEFLSELLKHNQNIDHKDYFRKK